MNSAVGREVFQHCYAAHTSYTSKKRRSHSYSSQLKWLANHFSSRDQTASELCCHRHKSPHGSGWRKSERLLINRLSEAKKACGRKCMSSHIILSSTRIKEAHTSHKIRLKRWVTIAWESRAGCFRAADVPMQIAVNRFAPTAYVQVLFMAAAFVFIELSNRTIASDKSHKGYHRGRCGCENQFLNHTSATVTKWHFLLPSTGQRSRAWSYAHARLAVVFVVLKLAYLDIVATEDWASATCERNGYGKAVTNIATIRNNTI